MITATFKPMRPGISLTRGALEKLGASQPGKWSWQPKLDEERGFIIRGNLFNRHGRPFAAHKAALFEKAIDWATTTFPDCDVIDVGALGFRSKALGRGAFVIFDVIDHTDSRPWKERQHFLEGLDPLPLPALVLPGELYRLDDYEDGLALYDNLDATRPEGYEGVVGRRLDGQYQQGESTLMVKARFV